MRNRCPGFVVLLWLPLAAAGAAELTVGQPIDGGLAPGETATLSIAASAGQYLRLRLDQQGIDLGLELHGPDGALLRAVDGPGGRWIEELLSLITEAAGSHRLEISARPGETSPGRYRITLEALRNATPDDAARLHGEQLFHRGRHLRRLPSREERLRAIDHFSQAASVFHDAGDLRGEAGALAEMGNVHRALGEPETAAVHLRRALALHQGSGHLAGQAEVENDLGHALRRLGQTEEAHGHYQRALELWRDLDDPKGQAMTLTGIGGLHRDQGELQPALDAYRRALTLRRAAGDLPGEAVTLSNLGVVYSDLGELAQTVDAFERAGAIARETGHRGREAVFLFNLAAAHATLGELQPALDGYLEVRSLARALGDQRLEQRVLTNLADVYRDLGEPEQARDILLAALERVRASESRVEEAWLLMTLGWVEDDLGRPDDARRHFADALRLSRETGVKAAEMRSLWGLARCHRRDQRPAEALAILEQALALSRELGHVIAEADNLREAGEIRLAAGQPEPARDHLRLALERALELADPIREATIRGQLARAERALGHLAEARVQVEAALDGYAGVRTAVVDPELRASFRAGRFRDWELHVDLLMELDRRQPELGAREAALASVERSRARGLVELLAEAGVEVRPRVAPELEQRERQTARRLSGIQSRLIRELSRAERDPARLAILRQRLAAARDERRQLEREIRRRDPRYAEVRYPRPLELDGIRPLLEEGTALLEYALGAERSFVFVVTRDRLSVHQLAPAATLAAAVERFRAAASQPSRRLRERLSQASRQLHEQLIAPATSALAGIETLLIAPDRELYHLPFEALTAAGGDRLLAHYAVAYVPSASVLSSLDRPPSAPPARRFVGFAQPLDPGPRPAAETLAVDATRGSAEPFQHWSWRPLPGPEAEVRSIARLFPPPAATVYVGAAAGGDRVKSAPQVARADLLLFAAHGLIDDREPAYSGLLLGADPASGDDGLLQVHEIFDLRIGAELVVLSACDTGLGKPLRGEGILGLSRAFFYAGAASLVVSLWPVADASSGELMEAFYRHLQGGAGKAEALAAAKRELLAGGRYAHPFYWAPFILVGQPR